MQIMIIYILFPDQIISAAVLFIPWGTIKTLMILLCFLQDQQCFYRPKRHIKKQKTPVHTHKNR